MEDVTRNMQTTKKEKCFSEGEISKVQKLIRMHQIIVQKLDDIIVIKNFIYFFLCFAIAI